MNLSKIFNKKALSLLFVSVALISASLFSFPEKAHAVLGAGDTVTDPIAYTYFTTANASLAIIAGAQTKQLFAPSVWNILEQDGILPALQAIAEDVATQIIQSLTEATVNWINNGFNGQPPYVADIGNFLQQTGDQVVGDELLNDPSLNFLCAPFQLQVKLALNLSYSQPFYKAIGCTLTGALANIQNAGTSFADGGGWNSWLQLTTQPQNNAQGAFLIEKDNIDALVAGKQNSASMEISAGQGALSYKDCTQTTYDSTGNEISTKPSPKGSNFVNGSTTVAPTLGPGSNGNVYTKTNCTVDTPGAVITNMLGFSATDNIRVTELKAALSNGIDQVLGSLANVLIQKGVAALKNGILGDNTAENNNYQNQLNSILQQQQSQYNQTVQQIQNPDYTPNYNISSQLSQYDDFLNSNSSSSSSNYSSGFNPAPPVATTTSQGISLTDPFYTEKTNSISIIDGILNSEAGYQNTYETALNILLGGRGVFANTISCYQKLGDPTSYTRALNINANVISNIDQTINYSMTVPQILWTLPYLYNSIGLSNTHVTFLETAESTVANATTNDAIVQTMSTVNQANFNKDEPIANMISDMTTWFNQMGITYTTAQCPIDLTSALSGAPAQTAATSATSTVGTASSTSN